MKFKASFNNHGYTYLHLSMHNNRRRAKDITKKERTKSLQIQMFTCQHSTIAI